MKNSIILLCLLMGLSFSAIAQPLISIDSVQYVPSQVLATGVDTSRYEGDTIQIEGIVTFDPCAYALSTTGSRIGTWLQMAGTNGEPWTGIHVLIDPNAVGYSGTLAQLDAATKFIDNFQVGNKVKCTGVVSTFSNYTQLLLIPVQSTVTGFQALPNVPSLDISDFQVGDAGGNQTQQIASGEPYEGIVVQIDTVQIADLSLGTGGNTGRIFWSLKDGLDIFRVRDMSGFIRDTDTDLYCQGGTTYTPTPFDVPEEFSYYTFVRGIMVEFGGEYYIAVRDTNDIGDKLAAPPVVSNVYRDPVVATSSQTVTVYANIEDSDGTVTNATLNYSYGLGNMTFTTVSMTNTSGTNWSASIPGPGTDGEYVNFWIGAEDNTGITSAFPDSMASGSFYQVLDNGIDEISDIQNTPLTSGSSIWDGDTLDNINLTAIVTAGMQDYDLGLAVIQDGTGPWSGVFLRATSGSNVEDLMRGDEITITSAVVDEDFNVTFLRNISYTLNSSGNTLPAFATTLNPDSIDAGVMMQAEAYEGMLCEWTGSFVTEVNADDPSNFGEWRFNTSNTPMTGLRADDYSNDFPFDFNIDSLTAGQSMSYIRGVLYYSFSNWKLQPRNQADLDGFTTSYPKEITSFEFNGLTPSVAGTIDPVAQTITVVVPNGTNVTNLVPTISYNGVSISPNTGVAQDFSSPVTYTVTAPVDGSTKDYIVTVTIASGVADLSQFADLEIYPNPADHHVVFDLELSISDNFEVSIFNTFGQELISMDRSFVIGSHRMLVNTADLSEGIYFVKISSSLGEMTHKLQIVR